MLHSASKSASQILLGATVGRILNLVTMVLVTPILGPEGFGTLAVASMIMAIFTVVVDVGFENYYIVYIKLVGEKKSSDEEIREIEDTVFFMRLYSNIFLFIAQVALSHILVGRFIQHPTDLFLRIFALNYLGAIFGKINEVRFRKQLNFKSIASAKIISDVCGAIIKLILVFSGFGIVGWAIGSVFAGFVNAFVLSIKGKYRPHSSTVSKATFKKVLWFAKHSWLTGLGQYFQGQISNISLKTFFSLKAMGYFQFANTYTVDFYSQITASQSSWIVPYISNLQDDNRQLLKGFHKMINIYLMVLSPSLIIGMVFSKEIILIVFGTKWLYASNMVVVLLAYILLRSFFTPTMGIVNALGKMKQGSIMAMVNFTILALSLLLTCYFTKDLLAFTIAFAFSNLLGEFIKSTVGLHFLKISWFNLLSNSWIHLRIIILVFVFFIASKMILITISPLILCLIILSGLLLYGGTQFFFNRKNLIDVFETGRNILRKRKK